MRSGSRYRLGKGARQRAESRSNSVLGPDDVREGKVAGSEVYTDRTQALEAAGLRE